jgi:signal transduction histidine kinase/CheY-like chemotaxis protein
MEENLRILLVEDNPGDALLLRESISQVPSPPDVIHSETLSQALDILRRESVDAVLLDLALSDSEGLKTLERTNAVADHLPIIVLTGLEDEAVAIESLRKGAQDYLLKGQTGAVKLVQTIHHAVERKRLERELARSAQRHLILAEVSAKVLAHTELTGLLKTVAEAARQLTSALIGCAGCGYFDRRFRYSSISLAEDLHVHPAASDLPHSKLDLILPNRGDSIRLSDYELLSHIAYWDLQRIYDDNRGYFGVRLVDAQGAPTGSLLVGCKHGGREFTKEDETLLRQLALITSLAQQHIEARTAAESASIAKSQFLANMSHELRTPMNAILGMTDLALAEELPPTVRDYLQTARESADVLLELLNEILDFSRAEAGRFELELLAFSLRKTVEQVVRTLRVRASEKGLALILHMPSEIPDQVVGDSLRLRQILMNLIDNAIKFTRVGKIIVKASVKEQTSEMVRLEFSVSDTGIGISREDRERIFAPFTQADASTTRNYGGTGLGLAISSKLVELMQGQIWVESNPEQGSTFCFTVCLNIRHGADPEAPEAAEAAVAHAPKRALRVLVVEDTVTGQKLAEYLLAKRGHIAEIARDGRQAVEMISRGKYDAVLMDVQMPVMDGFQATAAVRALPDPAKARLPIIAMTAHALKGDAERCLEAGMDAYISKPIRQEELIELIELLGEAESGAEIKAPEFGKEYSDPEPATYGKVPPLVFNLKAAIDKCFGKYDFFLDMVKSFFSEADEQFQAMFQGSKQSKIEDVYRAAHQLKNTVLYLGAQPALDALNKVEQEVKSGALEAVDQALRELEAQLEYLKQNLLVYRRDDALRSDNS